MKRVSRRNLQAAVFSLLWTLAFATPSIGPRPQSAVDRWFLGFESEDGIPTGSTYTGWYASPHGTFHFDSDVKHGGKRSVRFERTAESPGDFSFLSHSLDIEFDGKTIELRGWLRREGAGVPSLWLRQNDGAGALLEFKDMSSTTVVSAEWAQYSISFERKRGARLLTFGVRLVGEGKAWADDLELLVDGVPIEMVPRNFPPKTIVETDTEFATGSKIAPLKLSERQLDTLVLTAKIWGFLKYHHPAVTGGKQHWDFALLRRLPKLLQSTGMDETQRLLVEWIDSLGPVPACMPCVSESPRGPVKPRLEWIGDSAKLGEHLSARLRMIHANRGSGPQFFVTVAPQVGNAVFLNEPNYINTRFPDAGFQLLAVFRLWNMVEYWAPYRDLIDEDRDAVLRDSLERFALPLDRPSFFNEVSTLVARLDDGHANLGRSPATGAAPLCPLPFTMRYVEGKRVVDGIPVEIPWDLRVGDVIVEIDGRPVGELANELRAFQGASNEPARMRRIDRALTWGPCGKTKLVVDRSGRRRVAIERRTGDWEKLLRPTPRDRPGETLQWLSPKIAYLKLSTIKQAEIEKQMTEIVARADALVVDIRNYPAEFVVFALGSRLAKRSTPFATFTLPDLGNPGAFDFKTTVSVGGDTPFFGGRVAILVDESTQSQAEYTTMALRASARSIVVGSQTAGADGNVSPIVLPGNAPAGISGIGVFYPDRTPTQQVGVRIDVPCAPTIAGIRAGRDEILECALRELEKGTDLFSRPGK